MILRICLSVIFTRLVLQVAAQDCIESENPNSATVPMVSPPRELVGLWQGSNCGINDPSPTPARLEMQASGTNVWYFDGLAQTGTGVEAVIGWECIDVGKGYWWGMVPNSTTMWCNLFQVTLTDKGVEYINWSYGGEGVGAIPLGYCPHNLSTAVELEPLQASFVLSMPDDASVEGALSCNVPASSGQEQPSCNSQFGSDPVPEPFSNNATLPAIDASTCRAISDTSSGRTLGDSVSMMGLQLLVSVLLWSWI